MTDKVGLIEELGDNGWTGGQYSVLRFVLGSVLGLFFLRTFYLVLNQQVQLQPSPSGWAMNLFRLSDSPALPLVLLALGFLFSVMFAIGLRDRQVGIFAGYLMVCASRRFGLQSAAVLDFAAWVLLLHYLTPQAPYGSVAAVGREDLSTDWRLPATIRAIAWIFLAFVYFGVGLITIVQISTAPMPGLSARWHEFLLCASLVDLLFPAAIFSPRLRIPLWLILLVFTPIQLLVLGQVGAMFSILLVHLFVFDPLWVVPIESPGSEEEMIFFDGECGMCHTFVRFVLTEDWGGKFHFSPLQSAQFKAEAERLELKKLPDSIAVKRGDGALLFRSDAVIYILKRLAGIWRVFGTILQLFPRPVRDWAYDLFAAIRKKIFARPEGYCPIVDGSIMSRFRA